MNFEDKVLDVDDLVRGYMSEFLNRAYNERTDDKQIAEFIREKLEERDPGKWNVIVGKDFASHVTHLAKKYGYWKLGEQNILIWQSG